jgi:membrane protein
VAKSNGKAAKKGKKGGEGGLEKALAPVAGIVVVGAAMGRTLMDRRTERDGANDVPPGGVWQEPGPEPAEEAEQPERTGIKAKLMKVPVLGWVVKVQERYSELRGNNIASAVTFQAFVSIFPMLLVIVAAVGFVTHHSDVNLADRIVGNLGLTGEARDAVNNAVETAQDSRKVAGPVGLAGLFWSGLGLVNALQYAYNQVWQVEERGLKDKAVGMGWLLGAAVLFVGASAVTTVLNWLPGFFAPLGIAVSLGVNFLLWLWTAKVLPNRDVGWKPLIPGAILGAVGMVALKFLGAIYVPKAVANSSELYGSLGVVFAVLAWLLFFGRLIIYSAVLNVVLHERRAGTIKTTIEVPASAGVRPDETTRSGRVEKEDINT